MKKSTTVTNFHGLISSSPKMLEVFELIKRASKTDSSILLRGESGTGKELFAKSIHMESLRKKMPYKALNCATLSEELMISELFGHVKGAFTGAVSNHDGLFSVANNGSIFLDEIAEIPFKLQAKLLRVFQEKAFNRVGSTKVEHANVRFISATHTSLRNLVADGRFREDLMYRLRVVPLFLPALREREGDIHVLVERFMAEFNQQGHRNITSISKQAMDALLDYSWPGNIRELRNNIEYAFAIGRGDQLELTDLSPELQGLTPPSQTNDLDKMERERLVKALREAEGNKTRAAELFGASRPTFWRKCKLHNVY